MAYESLGKQITLEAAGDLSNYQYRFGKVNTSGQVSYNTVAGGDVQGVIQNAPGAQGRGVTLNIGTGMTKVVAGNIVTRGDKVASDNQGRAVTAVSGDHILGIALEAAGAAGERITVLFDKSAGTL